MERVGGERVQRAYACVTRGHKAWGKGSSGAGAPPDPGSAHPRRERRLVRLQCRHLQCQQLQARHLLGQPVHTLLQLLCAGRLTCRLQ